VWTAKSGVIPDEERPAYVKPEFLKEIAQFDPVVLPQLRTPHVRLNQLTSDEDAVPLDAQKKIADALPASAEKNHFQDDIEFYGAVASGGRVFDWMKQQLKPAKAATTASAKK
jgi:hypothetical protein